MEIGPDVLWHDYGPHDLDLQVHLGRVAWREGRSNARLLETEKQCISDSIHLIERYCFLELPVVTLTIGVSRDFSSKALQTNEM